MGKHMRVRETSRSEGGIGTRERAEMKERMKRNNGARKDATKNERELSK